NSGDVVEHDESDSPDSDPDEPGGDVLHTAPTPLAEARRTAATPRHAVVHDVVRERTENPTEESGDQIWNTEMKRADGDGLFDRGPDQSSPDVHDEPRVLRVEQRALAHGVGNAHAWTTVRRAPSSHPGGETRRASSFG